jgi:ribonuclease HII
VVAAAVVLDPDSHVSGLADSKLVPADEREALAVVIRARSLAWAVAVVDAAEIDQLNIHRASLQAMREAVAAIAPLPDAVLVDGFRIPDLAIPQRGIVKGDRRCAAIAAASIVAKVARDRLMLDLHARDPRYGFDRHKGYATAEHLDAVGRYGYSLAHRRTFRPPTLFD